MSESKKKSTIAEEDIDDDFLDDALDGFTAPTLVPQSKPAPSSTSFITPKILNPSLHPHLQAPSTAADASEDNVDDKDEGILDEEFSETLAMGMEELMMEMNANPELKQSFEEMFNGLGIDGMNSAARSPSLSSSKPGATGSGSGISAASTSSGGGKSFQDRVAKTMDKLKDSSEQVDSQVAEGSEEALMAEMMKQMEGMSEGGDFQNVLDGMMEQLMSKDILYEPMLDLKNKYPQWLEENKDKISSAEYIRYEKQHGYVKQIVECFERPDFDDKSESRAKDVIELMQGIQDCGQPPADILSELAPGLEMGTGA
ncbi:Peroxisome chaperone and import receptor [Mortierella polycephala]|uniref:Peroxisome chaperone and import receptor n=1 Tax=Mortierella polycephala TaxID=41804 RepID=A0A9P6QFJ6_9FUNG|nr:Peroxisome chaperone and import receptor [Mortierella polycephala]